MKGDLAKPEENFTLSWGVNMLENVDAQVMENRGPYAERESQRLVLDTVNRDPSDMNSFLKVWFC